MSIYLRSSVIALIRPSVASMRAMILSIFSRSTSVGCEWGVCHIKILSFPLRRRAISMMLTMTTLAKNMYTG